MCLIAVPVGSQVDPDHQGIGGEAHQEDEDVEDGEGVKEGGLVDGARTPQRLHVGQVMVSGGQVQLLPQLNELREVVSTQTHGDEVTPGKQGKSEILNKKQRCIFDKNTFKLMH